MKNDFNKFKKVRRNIVKIAFSASKLRTISILITLWMIFLETSQEFKNKQWFKKKEVIIFENQVMLLEKKIIKIVVFGN